MKFRVAKDGLVTSPAQTVEVNGRSLSLSLIRQPLRALVEYAAFALAFYLAYRSGMSFSQAAASPFWFPDSVLLCALLKSRRELWWLFILSTVPIRVFSDVAADIPLW